MATLQGNISEVVFPTNRTQIGNTLIYRPSERDLGKNKGGRSNPLYKWPGSWRLLGAMGLALGRGQQASEVGSRQGHLVG